MAVKNSYFIPKIIKVGYQERTGTYTGKLAYIIYYDHKNTLRKATSWKNWCNSKLGDNDFDNIPTEGFVLNKSVGGYRSDWNYRSAYFRVYDPRGFEFEITPENLLWILDWCACYPGKGIEGKFIYGWDSDQLILIPCNTESYKTCAEYSNRMYEGINKSELEPGSIYRIKGEQDVIYVGNLKLAKQMGKGYISKYMFLEKKEPWKIKCQEYNTDYLIVKDKSSILHKISEGPLSKEEIDEIIYRFSICPMSYDFWHNKNLIDRFVPCDNENGIITKGNNHASFDYDKKYNMRVGIISEDKKSVILNKPCIMPYKTSYGSYMDVKQSVHVYKFAELTANMDITKIADLGKYLDPPYGYRYDDYNKYYEDPDKTPEDKLEYVTFIQNVTTPVFYITKDNYIYNLGNALMTECISFLKHPIPSTVKLPVKYNSDK